MKRIANWIFHPFLFAIYPIIFLFTNNMHEVRLLGVLRPVVLSLALATILLSLFWLVFRNWSKAAVLVSVFMVLFFAYGAIYNVIEKATIYGFLIGRHRYLILLSVFVFLFASWLIGQKLRDTRSLTEWLNLVAVGLFILLAVQSFTSSSRIDNVQKSTAAWMNELNLTPVIQDLHPPEKEKQRDVYYIVLDGYTRQDVLADEFHFDNSAFLSSLRQRGFYVPDCSLSSYSKTSLSIPTALNMDMITDLAPEKVKQRASWKEYTSYLRHNLVKFTFSQLGYKTFAFETGHYWANVTDVDVYYTTKRPTPLQQINPPGITNFEYFVLTNSAFQAVPPALSSRLQIMTMADINGFDDEGNAANWNVLGLDAKDYYDLNLFSLDQLQKIPQQYQGPNFVYAHLLVTHPPYVFEPDGSPVYVNDRSPEGYVRTIQYANKRMITVIDDILANSDPKPIIVLQADHGFFESEHITANFSAFYFPDGGEKSLYPTISQVNVFRLIFNQYFGANLPLREDISMLMKFFSLNTEFSIIKEHNPKCY